MMKQVFCLALINIPLLLFAQLTNNNDLKWEKGLTWRQVKEKALKENKYIFVDCFATWCEPCKKMDQLTYSSIKVDSAAQNFICLKVQMDTTKNDNDETKHWYQDAHFIMTKYQITNLPSFLFFAPDGTIRHKDIGFKNASEFLELLNNALDPQKQYFTQLYNYTHNKKNYLTLPNLATTAKRINEKDIANRIAKDYINNYLFKSKSAGIFKKETIEFICSFTSSSKDKAFEFIYRNVSKMDSIMNENGFSETVIESIISREVTDPIVNSALKSNGQSQPDWIKALNTISQRFNSQYAEQVVLNAQLKWSTIRKDWNGLIKYNVIKIDKYGLDTAGIGWVLINNMIWEIIFKHCSNRDTIAKAIRWMEVINTAYPNDASNIDTYANLLYKNGQIKEALYFEERAASLAPTDENIQKSLYRMKVGMPTWLED